MANSQQASAPICAAAKKYPQLALPIAEGARTTPEYKDAVLRGLPVGREPEFIGSPDDSLTTLTTPAGCVDVLFLAEREDFVHAYRALAYRCEPKEIPASVGAGIVSGLINWEKIHRHEEEYLSAGGQDWEEEFDRFTADKANYIDRIVVLSSGPYSAVPAEELGLPEQEWKEKSRVIRQYHELTHFVCRTLDPDNIEPLRDEVVADLVGLLAAFGEYDTHLAERFLGIDLTAYRPDGRLAHYSTPENLQQDIQRAHDLIDRCARLLPQCKKEDVFATLQALWRSIT